MDPKAVSFWHHSGGVEAGLLEAYLIGSIE